MKMSVEKPTGRITLYRLDDASPLDGQIMKDITPEIQAVLDAGGSLEWVPDDSNNWQGSGELTQVLSPLEVSKNAKRAEVATARYAEEMGGFNLPAEQGGMFVRTDARNRTLLNAASVRAASDPAYEVPNWKTHAGDFITLTNAMILTLNGAVEQFIAGCFAKEKALNDAIAATTTVQELNAIRW